ncbi:MAG: NAD(P)H-dependent oxidoreductase [Gammaproteobacteria bacterium]|nr:MAG: NAD(P)H-dependent oxidoreductase [Gammaproteobacteria bacterium]
MSPNVLGVAGSLRHDSWNRRLLGALAELAGDDLRLTVYDGLEQIPLFNEDAEEPTPPGVRQLREAVRGADGLLIATPEYNQSMPGVLKNAIDWLSRTEPVLETKPVAVIGATVGNWGTRLAQAAVRQALTATGALVMPQPMLFVARANERFDPSGRLHDAEVSSGLRKVAQAFRQWMVAHR